MPRKPLGLRPLRQPKTRAKRMRDFDIRETLCFIGGWSPPRSAFDLERSRWRTWDQFLADYQAVRAELHKKFGGDRRHGDGELIFAERALRLRDEFGLEHLDAASYEEIRHGDASNDL
jgi:hypothetical protein